MNVLGVTLARGGSRGVPRKHLLDLCGKPVIEWTIEAAMDASLSHYVISSDDQDILDVASYAAFLINRPAKLAQDDTPTLPALQHAVRCWEQAADLVADFVIEIRATSPLKTAADIDACIDLLITSGADSVIGVCELSDHHPARIKQVVNGRIVDWWGLSEPVSGRRQDCKPKAYIRNGTIYALRREAVMGPDGRLFGHEDSRAFCMPPERSVNIDTPLDFKLCQLLMAERLKVE